MGRVLQGLSRGAQGAVELHSPISALAVVLRTFGLHVDYSELMCLGGPAFRAVWGENWSESSPFTYNEDAIANIATMQGFSATTKSYVDEDEAWRTISQSIDSGMPLLTCGIRRLADWAVIVGYEDNPRRLLFLDMVGEQNQPVKTDFASWSGWTYSGHSKLPLTILKRIGKVTDSMTALKMTLERAVRIANEPAFKVREVDGSHGLYHSGIEAYRQWAEDAMSMAVGTDEEGLDRRLHISLDNIKALIDARQTATAYLERIKRRGSRQIHDAAIAIDRFGREVVALEEALESRTSKHVKAIETAGKEYSNAIAALGRTLKPLS